MESTQAHKSSMPLYEPSCHGCVVVVVVITQGEESQEVRRNSFDIHCVSHPPIGPNKVWLWLAAIDAVRFVHCPVPPTLPENWPTARSQLQKGKPDAGLHTVLDVGWSVGPGLKGGTGPGRSPLHLHSEKVADSLALWH